MKLLTYLQTTHHLSRRNIIAFIQQGKILVNGEKVESFKHELIPNDRIILPNGTQITVPADILIKAAIERRGAANQTHLLLFNKPKGYTVSKSDLHNHTIYELLPAEFQHYYYIGRLDKESRGLVLLTDNPELVHRYTHPSFNIIKEYVIQLSAPISAQHLQQMTKIGVHNDGDLLKFKTITPTLLPNQYKITLNEGKKRHIRRVIKTLGYKLLDLQRIKEGERTLNEIREGKRKTSTITKKTDSEKSISQNHCKIKLKFHRNPTHKP